MAEPSQMVDRELHHEIEQFLFREARLLDEGRYREWLDLLTEDIHYWMPARETRAERDDGVRKAGELALFEDNKDFLRARIERLETGLAHAEEPPSRTRHFVSNVEVDEIAEGELEARCSILLFQSRLERTENFFVGCRTDRLRRTDGGWRISARTITLDQTLLPRTISTFF